VAIDWNALSAWMARSPKTLGPAGLLFGGMTSAEKESERFAKEKQQVMDQIRMMYDPAYRAKMVQQYYQQALSSPAYAQAQGTIAAGANRAGSQIAASLGQSGLNQSGLGAVMSGMVPSMVGGKLAGLRTAAYQSGASAADSNISSMVNALLQGLGMQGPAPGLSQGQQIDAGTLASLSSILGAKFGTPATTAPAVATRAYSPALGSLPSAATFNNPYLWNWQNKAVV
jgi:hypothetical protein